jgi:hypothetical protein
VKEQLGTHSVLKGSVTYCTGMICGPSVVQIFLRAGWSLGSIQDRYISAGEGGDQLTGRVLAGLSCNDSSFALLPPHFDDDGVKLISDKWNFIIPLFPRLGLPQSKGHCQISLHRYANFIRPCYPGQPLSRLLRLHPNQLLARITPDRRRKAMRRRQPTRKIS